MSQEQSPATLGRDEIERFRRGDILLSDEQANRFCDLALSALSERLPIQRYTLEDLNHGKPQFTTTVDGPWVKYEDVCALSAIERRCETCSGRLELHCPTCDYDPLDDHV